MSSLAGNEGIQSGGRRIGFVDVARGIAIWSIVLGHQGISDINRVVFTFHVPIFFLLAGCFFREEASLDSFLKKKVRSLLRPYFMASVALFVFGVAFHVLRFGSCGLPSELARRLAAPVLGMGGRFPFPFGLSVPGLGRYMPPIGATWFLLALFWTLLLMRCVCRVRIVWQPYIVLGLFLLGCRSTNTLWIPWSLQAGFCALLFVYVGYLAKPLVANHQLDLRLKGMLLVFGFGMWGYFIRDFSCFSLMRCKLGRGFPDIVCSLAACWCVLEMSRFIDARLPHLASVLGFFGRHSLIVLCAHVVELHSWGPVWRKIGYDLSVIGLPNVCFILIGLKILAIAGATGLIVRFADNQERPLHA